MKITENAEYDIRYSVETDLTCLLEWLSMPELRRWYPISSDNDVEAMGKNWIGFYRFGASLTATLNSKPVGIATLFLMPYRKLIHHCLLYFIVDPAYSRQGIGTSIIRNAIHLATKYFHFEKIGLEIYEKAPALSLLKKLGFQEIVRQEHFVKEGDNNYLARLIMEKNLQSQGMN